MKVKMKKKYYERTDSGESWKSKPYKIETKAMPEEHYRNYVSDGAISFMRNLGGSESVSREYTPFGYLICEVSSVSPDRTDKRVATFEFEED